MRMWGCRGPVCSVCDAWCVCVRVRLGGRAVDAHIRMLGAPYMFLQRGAMSPLILQCHLNVTRHPTFLCTPITSSSLV